MSGFHGFSPRREEPKSLEKSAETGKGKFGRLFPELPHFTPSEESLTELGEAMVDPDPFSKNGDNESVPAGFTYLGQFVDHDITFDITPLQESLTDPWAVENFRTPMLDLDSIYGAGPKLQPYLYELSDPDQFLIGLTSGGPKIKRTISQDPPLLNDIPRVPMSNFGSLADPQLGLIADPRNDETLILSQLHLAFLKFHNKVVQEIKTGKIHKNSYQSTFEQARQLVIWHYQWIIIHDFLRRILDKDQLDLVLNNEHSFYHDKQYQYPFIPIEFSVAAYRLGHSMIRQAYNYNQNFVSASLEDLFALTAKSRIPGSSLTVPIPNTWIIDWKRFSELDSEVSPTEFNFSRKLNSFLVKPLTDLPNVLSPKSLAVRNLLRGRSLGLPSGQSIAKFMDFKPLTEAELSQGSDGEVAKKHNFHIESPLWYYILKEAELKGQGNHLGQVGSRIVAEVFVGLLRADKNSFLHKIQTGSLLYLQKK